MDFTVAIILYIILFSMLLAATWRMGIRVFSAVTISALLSAIFLMILVPWLYYWLFTGLKGQTLGKMAVGIRVVNAEGSVPGLGMAALREIPGKIVSSIVICLGFFWIIWDVRKQGWHDKIAKTYVVRVESRR